MNRAALPLHCFAFAAMLAGAATAGLGQDFEPARQARLPAPQAHAADQPRDDSRELAARMQRLPAVEGADPLASGLLSLNSFAPARRSPHEALWDPQDRPEAAGLGGLQALDEPPLDAVLPPPDYPWALEDPTLGPAIRVFEPKARVYFDTGWEAPDKLDIFHDGSLAPSINFLEIFWAHHWPENLGQPDWRWGPNIGVGISSRAGDSSDGSRLASGAPVLLVSYGLVFEFPLTSAQTDALRAEGAASPAAFAHLRRLAPKAGVEFGYALGVSADETLDYSADGAIYVGVTLHVLP